MSDEAAATWTNGDGGRAESEAVLDSYCQPPDPEMSSTEPSRKRTRSSSSDSNQSSAESSQASQTQKKMKIVVRNRSLRIF